MISTFLVELHPDDVLEVLLDLNIFFNKIEIYKYYWKIHTKMTVIYIMYILKSNVPEFHLEFVLEVHMVVRSEFLSAKTCR